MSDPGIASIERIALSVGDLDAACAFFQALGFEETSRDRRAGEGFSALMGVKAASAEVALLRLGGQAIELCAFTPAGCAYPAERTAADPWFQHFAIVVADMDGAHAAAMAAGAQTISADGPVLLPPQTGSIRAWKFRDPEGHPLELSWFPQGVAPPAWRDPPAGRLFLGVDHSAIAVADISAGLAFYEALGMSVVTRQVNVGPTQDRLDGLPTAEVEIVSISPAGGGPHMELLGYRQPPPRPNADPPSPLDIAATRLILRVSGLERLLEVVQASGGAMVSDRLVMLEDGVLAALVRDPDGHLLELRQPAPS